MNFFLIRFGTEVRRDQRRSASQLVDGRWKLGIPIFQLRTSNFSAFVQLRLNKRGGSDGAAGVARGGWTIHFLERRPAINFSVGDRVHRATAGEREMVGRVLLMQSLKDGEKRFLIRRLD